MAAGSSKDFCSEPCLMRSRLTVLLLLKAGLGLPSKEIAMSTSLLKTFGLRGWMYT